MNQHSSKTVVVRTSMVFRHCSDHHAECRWWWMIDHSNQCLHSALLRMTCNFWLFPLIFLLFQICCFGFWFLFWFLVLCFGFVFCVLCFGFLCFGFWFCVGFEGGTLYFCGLVMSFISKDLIVEFVSVLQEMRHTESIYDTVICVDGREVRGNRLLLSGISLTLREIFERHSSQLSFAIKNADADVMEMIVDCSFKFSYQPLRLSECNLEPVLRTGINLGCRGVLEESCRYIEKNTKLGTCMKYQQILWQVSLQYYTILAKMTPLTKVFPLLWWNPHVNPHVKRILIAVKCTTHRSKLKHSLKIQTEY